MILLRPVQLASEHLLDLEEGLIFVDSEELEKVVVVVIDQALEYFELHHVVFLLGILRHDITNLRLGQTLELVVKVLNLLSKVSVASLLVDTNDALRFVIESDEFVSEAPSDTTLWLVPLRVEWDTGLLRDDGSSKLLLWVGEESFWFERHNGGGTLLIHGTNLAVKVVAPLDLLEWRLSRELENLLSSLEVGHDSPIVFTGADNKAWIREAPRE